MSVMPWWAWLLFALAAAPWYVGFVLDAGWRFALFFLVGLPLALFFILRLLSGLPL
jgi:hypothetical protein